MSTRIITVRKATSAIDTDFIVSCYDSALPYLASIGSEDQFVRNRYIKTPLHETVRIHVEEGRTSEVGVGWIAEVEERLDGVPVKKQPAGAIFLNDHAPDYAGAQSAVPPVQEMYVGFLATDRRLGALSKGIGAWLLDWAKDKARKEGIKLIRLDCWRGGDGRLAR